MSVVNRGKGDRPSGRAVILAFAGAVAAAVALVAVAVLLRDDGAPPPQAQPVVDLGRIPQDGSVLGSPAARARLIEYADAQCPACRSYNAVLFPVLVEEYVRPGKVSTEFRGFPFIGPDSVTAYRFILAAGEQDLLWNFQEALYRRQGGENDGWVTEELLREVAGEIPGLDVDRLFADADRADIVEAAESADEEARALGIPGTPTLLVRIGDEDPYAIQVLTADELRAALDDALLD